jgi:shikimate kinase
MLKHIILMGMMGSGKTTLGKHLSEKINRKHIDLDDYIATSNNMNFQDFFNAHSIENFRLLELKYLEKLLSELSETSIISLGGGTLTHLQDLGPLHQHQTIYIRCNPQTLFQRLKTPQELNNRPLIRHLKTDHLEQKIEDMLHQRKKLYEQAQTILDNDVDIDITLNFLMDFLKKSNRDI